MEIKVNGCGNCPFHVLDYDDYAVGFDTIEYCRLARFLNYEDEYIDIYNGHERNNVCDYCENFNISDEEIDSENMFDETKCTCSDINKNKEDVTLKWCPLLKEQLIIKRNEI